LNELQVAADQARAAEGQTHAVEEQARAAAEQAQATAAHERAEKEAVLEREAVALAEIQRLRRLLEDKPGT
jgi:hypothetical protein